MINWKIDSEMRQWFIGPALMIWTGIYLTGFDVVSWVLYAPAVMSVFALTTGICPGMGLMRARRALFKRKDDAGKEA